MQDDQIALFFAQELEQHRATLEATRGGLAEPFARMLHLWEACIRAGGKLLVFGNGGSAADAQHITAELVVRYHRDRAPVAALALTTDTSALTAGANDMGFETVFARQVAALGRPGDLALGISTSGKSPNVLAALRQARASGMRTAGLSGGDGGRMAELCDALIVVPSTITARIQEMHITLGHMLCLALEERLGLVRG
jgi:D-sedoheptulose 7-phosphate isomerase